MTLPLTGLTVVSFEQAVAAPFCSRHLGDLGARVIKVEHRAGGRLHPRLRRRGARHGVVLRVAQPQQGVAHPRHQAPGRRGDPEPAAVPGGRGDPEPGARVRPPHGHRGRRRGGPFPESDRRGHFRLRRRWSLRREAGVRPAHPGRGWVVLHHGAPGRPGQGGPTGRRHGHGPVLADRRARRAVRARAHRRRRRHQHQHVRRHLRVHGLRPAVHPLHRGRTPAQRDEHPHGRSLRWLPHQRRADGGARDDQRSRVAATGTPDARTARPGRRPQVRHQHHALRRTRR